MKKPEEVKKGLVEAIEEASWAVERGDAHDLIDAVDNTLASMANALAYIQQLEAQVPRWISVEDEQKPKHHEDVLCRYVFSGNADCFYAVLTYYAYGDNGYVTGQHFTGEGLHDMRVTHWMPLPEPPKEDAHE